MAVQNSLANRTQKTGMAVYLAQDAVKKQINSVVGGKNGTRFISSVVSAVQTTPALLKRVSMTMDGILYETGLMRKNKFSGGSQWKTDAYVAGKSSQREGKYVGHARKEK